jgi:ribosomal protein S18 acetylase RimI-like enzyme
MRMKSIEVIPFISEMHRDQVVALWRSVFGYETAHNDPRLSIDRKVAVEDGLFFVAVDGVEVVGTIMAGYDGHRGWMYSLAVASGHRRRGIGRGLAVHAERALVERGCVKINLQILEENAAVAKFYEALGFVVEKRISMGKRLPQNVPGSGNSPT